MRRWTAADMTSPRRSACLFVALSALGLVGASSPGAAREKDGGASERQVRRSLYIEAEDLPDWWLPLFCPMKANDLDGYMCGFGVRLGRGFFLAHKIAVNRLLELDNQTIIKAPMFLFKPETTINSSAPLRLDQNWNEIYVPTLTYTFKRYIGLYRTDIRPGSHPESAPQYRKYPLKSSVCLENDTSVEPENCFLVTYDEDNSDGRGPSLDGARRLKLIWVKENACHGSICFMKIEHRAGETGDLCGFLSNLGNGIMCEEGLITKVTYIVWSVVTPDNSGQIQFNCTGYIRAVKVAHFTDHLWNVHTRFIREMVRQATAIPSWPG